jgi:peptidyl-prolyl cis-trans isomerase SurA
MRLTFLTAACLMLSLVTVPALAAGGPYDPRLYINNAAITNFEVEQRVLFLKALNSPGDLEKLAVEGLIDDRLRLQAAKTLDLEVSEKDLTQGLADFASRAKLTTEQFLKALAEGGVEPESFRDFVRAGIAWREVIRAKFVPMTTITDADIDRALSVTAQRGEAKVLLSELLIPAPPGQEADALAQAQELRASIGSEADFATAAVQFSAAPTAPTGGKIDWLPIGNLPPALREILLLLSPGQVSEPVPIPNAVALFLMRGLQESARPATQAISVDYVEVLFPNDTLGLQEMQKLANSADRCEDVLSLTRNLPQGQVTRQSQATAEVPRDVALELAKLDADEYSTALGRGTARVFLMLCSRNVVRSEEETPDRNAVREQLMNQRLGTFADAYLQELRAAAIIREP